MTPKEKAKELVNKFCYEHNSEKKEYYVYQNPNESKRCAKIAVEEILKVIDDYNDSELCHQTLLQVANDRYYWTEVLTEIDNL